MGNRLSHRQKQRANHYKKKMKKVLILAIGCQLKPWDKMIQSSLDTWDSIEVEGVETIFYCGEPLKENTGKIIYFPIKESYSTMGEKMIQAFKWALKNKEFDYIARVNSSCYVDKKELIQHIQTLPDKELFQGLIVPESGKNQAWCWGGGQYIISKDVIQNIVDNRFYWNHELMEDVALSDIATRLNIPFTNGIACSIDKKENGWSYTCYKTPNFESETIVKAEGQFFYRVKQDFDRAVDELIMKELYNVLK